MGADWFGADAGGIVDDGVVADDVVTAGNGATTGEGASAGDDVTAGSGGTGVTGATELAATHAPSAVQVWLTGQGGLQALTQVPFTHTYAERQVGTHSTTELLGAGPFDDASAGGTAGFVAAEVAGSFNA